MDRRGFLRAGAFAGMASAGTASRLSAAASPSGLGWLSSRPNLRADGTLRLNANENPLGISPGAREAVIEAITEANRYPDSRQEELVSRLAKRNNLRSENVYLGAGSTEILQMAVQALASSGRPLIVAEPTFEDVLGYRRPFPYRLVTVPLDFRYAHDLGRMREEAERSSRPSVVYICNPNNPTGSITPSAEVDAWIQDAPESVFFIIDEAYYELVDDASYWSALGWVDRRPNVLVTRTFSKIFGMAGLRIGYGLAHEDTVARFKEFQSNKSTTQLSAAAALASLDDDEFVAQSLESNRAAGAVVKETLDELGLGYLPSHTNFIMHEIQGDLQDYITRFLDQGIAVGRPFPPMLGYNRLSLGAEDEMGRWAETIRSFRARGWT
ncbi:MAG: histidinol-phosphate transaminase [Gemmatimonadota bacterium]|nr:MAG: histidinol-phosphate transaminase [Gemmatimonadota bacterium]